ncbi:hypothetical protein MPRS_27820 [Mycobacterium paraseoulense]|nr:hypothetical protein MPRS_27820 [Mycobacterium paraseoulense]
MIARSPAVQRDAPFLIGSAAWILATRPDIQRQVRDQPDLLGPFLEEVLRYEPPFRGHYRHVVNHTELCGAALPAGSRLLLLWGAANRDPSHFDNPGEFRLDRPAAKGHISFGKGIHFCVGAALARLEATIVLGQLRSGPQTSRPPRWGSGCPVSWCGAWNDWSSRTRRRLGPSASRIQRTGFARLPVTRAGY